MPIRLVETRPASALSELDDDDLMRLARAGREDAFEALLRRHQPLVLGVAARFLADRALGRDVMQDVFLSLGRERERYKPQARVRSYLLSLPLHRCHAVARARRSQTRRVAQLASVLPDTASPDEPIGMLVQRERARELHALLGSVPERQREVLILRFGEELELEEIAEATGRPIGTVKSHLFRGLKALRGLLHREPAP